MREAQRRAVAYQIVHDPWHERGVTRSYLLRAQGDVVGHGSIGGALPLFGAPLPARSDRMRLLALMAPLPLGLLLAGCAGRPAPGASPPAGRLEAFVAAHPDDWQLFMGDVAYRAIRDGTRTVFVVVTAGDAGLTPAYWLARERGALASVGFALGLAPPDGTGADADARLTAGCADTLVEGRAVRRCRQGATTSYFLRLPDGNMAGEGFATTGSRSLARIAAGSGAALTPLQGSGSYGDVDAVAAVVSAVLQREAAGAGAAGAGVRVHATDPDTAFNPRDHADHRATGHVAAAVARTNGWALAQYAGYSTAEWPTNLSAERFAEKAGLFMAYDRTRLVADQRWSAYAEAPGLYSAWLSRTYVRPPGFRGRSP